MAYVRERGNQLLIVHGERNAETRAVEQRVLFTIYSRAEAAAIAGVSNADDAHRFRSLMDHQYPDLRFDWKRISREISRRIKSLPENRPERTTDPGLEFREALCGFVRQLHRVDPQDLDTSVEVLERNRADLEYVADLIRWRLDVPRREPNEFTRDDQFHWRYFLHGAGVPPEAEESLAHKYESGEHAKAKTLAQLLIDTYGSYAEGHNYLGLIALCSGDLAEAEIQFRRTMEVGRAAFAAKIRRSSWWRDHATRPYMRGMRNLVNTLIRAGRWDDAEQLARRLADECADADSADCYRAVISLSTGRYGDAQERASRLLGVWPSQGFIVALAAAERSAMPEALEAFLHAAIHQPMNAQLLIRGRVPPGLKDAALGEARAGDQIELLHDYLRRRRRVLRRVFEPILDDPRVAALLHEAADVERRWSAQRGSQDDRKLFDRMTAMRKPEYAAMKAREWADIVSTRAIGALH